MSDGISTLLNGIFALLGVIIGAFIPWFLESSTRKRTRRERATYLAVRVVCILDEYADKCVKVVLDMGGEDGRPAECLPAVPDFPADLDWRSIDSALMYRILTFPNSARGENRRIQWVCDEDAWPPYYEEVFEARQKGYAKLGLEAVEIVEELRRQFKLPEANRPLWDAKKFLEDKLEKLKKRKAIAEKQEKMMQSVNEEGRSS